MVNYKNCGWIIVILFILAGCGTVGKCKIFEPFNIYADKNGMVTIAELDINKSGAVSVEREGIKMSMDSREKNVWEKNILPVFQRALQGAEQVTKV